MTDVPLLELDCLVDRHYQRIYRAARYLCDSPVEAEDLCQEVFLAAARGAHRFRGESGAYTWLYGILLNLNRVRRRSRQRRERIAAAQYDSAASPACPAAAAERGELSARVRELVLGLPPTYRDAVVLRYLEEMPLAEIAQVLEIPEGTVKSRLAEGRNLMKHRMKQAGLLERSANDAL